MITKCPHCSALLDCPQDPGTNVDCAGCGQTFIAQPVVATAMLFNTICPHCATDQEVPIRYQGKTVRCVKCAKEYNAIPKPDDVIRKEKERQAEAARQQNEIIRKEKEKSAEADRKQMEIRRQAEEHVYEINTISAIKRGSGWAILFGFIGFISTGLGVLFFVVQIGFSSPDFVSPVIAIISGLTCLFYAFLLNIFTDVRWLLAFIAKTKSKS